ncbi:MAG: VWA domain-containing protein [Clostridiales bacterium]|jgi:hypothetical protein|nr:VWA domain-containing protein [Clostridiales bacterium]
MKAFRLFGVIAACAALLAVAETAFAATEKSPVDMIVALDCSGSMESSDRNRLSLEAATLLLNQLENSESRFGFVMFDGGLRSIMPLESISSQSNINNIIQTLNSEYRRDGDNTDTPRAMAGAIQLLKDSSSANSKVIVLLTDGDDKPSRDRASMEAEREKALEEASRLGIKIYTIGLFDSEATGSSLSEIANAAANLEEISGTTKAKSFDIDSASELNDCVLDIYSNYINPDQSEDHDEENTIKDSFTGDGVEDPFIIPVSDSYVQRANINILSSALQQVAVQSPGGEIVALKETGKNPSILNEEKANIVSMDTYTVVRLISPEKGDWVLKLVGGKDAEVEIRFIYDYALKLNMSAEMLESGKARMKAWLTRDSVPASDMDIYKNVRSATFKVGASDASIISGYFDGSQYIADLEVEKGRIYEIQATLNHKEFTRISDVFTFDSDSPPAGSEASGGASSSNGRLQEGNLQGETSQPSASPETAPPPELSPEDAEKPMLPRALAIAAAAAAITVLLLALKRSGISPTSPITARLILVLTDSGHSNETRYNDFFLNSTLKSATLLDVVEYSFTDPSASKLMEKVKLIGVKDGIVFLSPKSAASISAPESYKGKPFLSTAMAAGDVNIALKDTGNSEVRLTLN